MKKRVARSVFVFFWILFSFAAQGQQQIFYSISGKILDSSSAAPLQFATAEIKGKANFLKRTITDQAGNFGFEKIPAGEYEIAAMSMGFRPVVVKAAIRDSTQSKYNAGIFQLPRNEKQLGEIKVFANKPLITQEIDKIAYNVQEDPESKSSNLLDILRKVPFVSVNGDDQLLFKGTSNFRVLLDGRNSSLMSLKNLRDVLKGMPASSILQIEVITVPPVRYEGEGLAGIINIITNRKLKDGYNGSANASYSRLFSNASASFNAKRGKFGITAFGGNSWEHLPGSPFDISFYQYSPTVYSLQQRGERKYNGRNGFGNIFMSFEPDTLHLITAGVGFNAGINRNHRIFSSALYDVNNLVTQSYGLYSFAKGRDEALDIGVNFQRGFKRSKTQFLTISYKYLTSASVLDNYNIINQKVNYFVNDIRQNNNSGYKEHSGQIDYVHPVKSFAIEGGVKFIQRAKYSEFTYSEMDPVSGQFIPEPGLSDLLDYNQCILSAYNSYTVRKKKWSVRSGLRLEKTWIDATFQSTNTALKQEYTNLLPSVSLLFRNKDMSTISMGYAQRIQRPGIQLLNPFSDQSDPRFLRSGNPSLRPVLNHNFNIGYSKFKKSTTNIGLSYSFARNTIQSVASSLAGDSIVKVTYQNIGTYDNAGLNINLGFPVGKQVNLTVNGTISYIWTKGVIDGRNASNQGIEGFAYSYLTYKTKKGWRFNLNAGFYGPVRNLQGNSNSYFYSSMGSSKQILRQKGTVSVTISNPFQKFRTLTTIIEDPLFYQMTINKNYFRNISVSFYYRFGKLSEEIKRNRRSINNDDKAAETGKAQ